MAPAKTILAPAVLAAALLLLTSDTAEAVATTQAGANALTFRGRDMSTSRYALSAHQSNGQRTCGSAKALTSWTIQTEQWWARQSNAPRPGTPDLINTLGGYFNTGTGFFSTPVNGVYYASIFGRCETRTCDMTLRLNGGTQLCGMGGELLASRGDSSNFGGTWVTHGCATLEYLTQGQTLSFWMESGGSQDCMMETNFVYNHINVMLLLPEVQIATFATGPSG